MVDSFFVAAAAGSAFGFLTGLGIGGGSLLVLWLTVALDMAPEAARSINLLFFIPSALISCLFRWKQGILDWKCAVPAILAGCFAAVFFTVLSSRIDTQILKKLFGGLLILTGLRELLYKPKQN